MVPRTTTPATGLPTETENIVEAVQLLHAMAYDTATIAKRLHLDMGTTLHVIQTGKLPQRQLSLAFKELPAVRPLDDEVGR